MQCHSPHLFIRPLLSDWADVLLPSRFKGHPYKLLNLVVFVLPVVRLIFFFFLLVLLCRDTVIFHEDICVEHQLFFITHKMIFFPGRQAVIKSCTPSVAVFIAALTLHLHGENTAYLRGKFTYVFPPRTNLCQFLEWQGCEIPPYLFQAVSGALDLEKLQAVSAASSPLAFV